MENKDAYPHFTYEEKLAQKVSSLFKVADLENGRAEIPSSMSSPKFFSMTLMAKHCLQYLSGQSEMVAHQQSQI